MAYSERRIARLSSLIKERVAEVLQRELRDPRLGFVTVTRVELDRELVLCKVFWSALGDDKERRLSEHALRHARAYVQRSVAAALPTRTVPRLEFHFDPSIEGAIRITRILKELEEERRAQEARGASLEEDQGRGGSDSPESP